MSRWKPKGPPKYGKRRVEVVTGTRDPSCEPWDSRYQEELLGVMESTDAEGAILLVLDGNKGKGFAAAFKAGGRWSDRDVPHFLRNMAALMETERVAAMPPEERRQRAQQQAEIDVIDYARRPDMAEQAQARGRSIYEQASRVFRAGLEAVGQKYDANRMTAADVLSVAAIALELYREALMQLDEGGFSGNAPGPDTTSEAVN